MSEFTGPPFEASGVKWSVEISRSGYFTAIAEGYPDVHSALYDDLVAKARQVVAKHRIKVSVPFSYVEWKGGSWSSQPARVRRGEATGIHGSNSNIMAIKGGKSVQMDRYRGDEIFAVMPEDDAAEMIRLLEERNRIAGELSELQKRYKINLRDQVEAAINRVRADREPARQT